MPYKKCSKCQGRHGTPRGKGCQHLTSPEPTDTSNSTPAPQGTELQNDLLASILQSVQKLDHTVNNFGTRLATLEQRVPQEATSTPPSQLNDLESGLHARMQALDVQLDEGDSDLELDPAGAGTGNPRARSATRGKPPPLKSGSVQTSSQRIVRWMDWPHLHLERTTGQEEATAQDLSISEFVWGFLEVVKDPLTKPEDKPHMLAFLQLLMNDAGVRPWSAVRHFHQTVLP